MTAQPQFTSPAARKLWDSYFSEVSRLLGTAGLAGSGVDDDLRDRLCTAFHAQPGEREVPRLEAAIRRIGRPADYLRSMLATALLDRGTRTYNPFTIGQGLRHALMTRTRTAVIGGIFALGYMLLIALCAVAVLKPILLDEVGLFRDADGQLRFGLIPVDTGGTDILGWWTIPLGLALAGVLYVVLTLLLRRWHKG